MYVAVMGYGTVGSGVVEVFNKNHESIVKRSTQSALEIRYILDLRDFPGDPNADKFIKDFNIILKAGKSVVSSNKELVAAKG